MPVLYLEDVGKDFVYAWAEGEVTYPHWIDYRACCAPGEVLRVRLGFRTNPNVYGRARERVIVWINDHVRAAFLGADDFGSSGEVLCEIKVSGTGGGIYRFPEEPVPASYSGLPVVGLCTRVSGPRVHNAWAVVANIADHQLMIAVAALRHQERGG
jgi:hypothetical protein